MQRAVMITSICLSVFARESSAGFRTKLGCYLHESGLAKRAIDVLSGFGITPTYKYVNQSINQMAERAKVSIPGLKTRFGLDLHRLGLRSWRRVDDLLSHTTTSTSKILSGTRLSGPRRR